MAHPQNLNSRKNLVPTTRHELYGLISCSKKTSAGLALLSVSERIIKIAKLQKKVLHFSSTMVPKGYSLLSSQTKLPRKRSAEEKTLFFSSLPLVVAILVEEKEKKKTSGTRVLVILIFFYLFVNFK